MYAMTITRMARDETASLQVSPIASAPLRFPGTGSRNAERVGDAHDCLLGACRPVCRLAGVYTIDAARSQVLD
jgi:hypothetical protein